VKVVFAKKITGACGAILSYDAACSPTQISFDAACSPAQI